MVVDKFQETQKAVSERERVFVAKAKREQEHKQDMLQYAHTHREA
jgi:hypothetical protein